MHHLTLELTEFKCSVRGIRSIVMIHRVAHVIHEIPESIDELVLRRATHLLFQERI